MSKDALEIVNAIMEENNRRADYRRQFIQNYFAQEQPLPLKIREVCNAVARYHAAEQRLGGVFWAPTEEQLTKALMYYEETKADLIEILKEL